MHKGIGHGALGIGHWALGGVKSQESRVKSQESRVKSEKLRKPIITINYSLFTIHFPNAPCPHVPMSPCPPASSNAPCPMPNALCPTPHFPIFTKSLNKGCNTSCQTRYIAISRCTLMAGGSPFNGSPLSYFHFCQIVLLHIKCYQLSVISYQ
ncbi:MAG: hypothetical protein F6J93_02320 [Oscillatoria sp. SIO1A7]|nr:hypothetical protein [Oscillatoria sp. SIO1A7]